MESKIPEWFLSFYENLLSAQLRSVRQLKSPKPRKGKEREKKGMSNMDMALDILRRAQRRQGGHRARPEERRRETRAAAPPLGAASRRLLHQHAPREPRRARDHG